MDIFYSEKHLLQNGRAELNDGQLMPCFENPQRATTILEALKESDVGVIKAPSSCDKSVLKKVHDEAYLQFLETAWGEWMQIHGDIDALPLIWPVRGLRQIIPQHIDGKISYYAMDAGTPITSGTWEAIMAAVDVTLSAQRAVSEGKRSAFALCRPPGHHASRDCYGGYCFINNAAVAAESFIQQGMKKVAIVDIDYHHGNGTQNIFYHRNDVMFISIHADPKFEFPYFLGYADEKGQGEGKGFNINYPLPMGSHYAPWKQALMDALINIKSFGAEALVVSTGLDTYKGDPISEFKLDSPDYIDIGKLISEVNLPTLFVLEGGYAVEKLGINMVNIMKGFELERV